MGQMNSMIEEDDCTLTYSKLGLDNDSDLDVTVSEIDVDEYIDNYLNDTTPKTVFDTSKDTIICATTTDTHQ